MMDTATRAARIVDTAPDTAAAPRAVPADNPQAQRIAWLFRHSLRAGAIHPAQHLIQRHRGVQGGYDAAPRPAPRPAGASAAAAIDAATLARSVGELPALPQVVLDLMTLLQDDGVNSSDVASRIERDQALMARTLRLANSPFYGVTGRVGTIRDAIQVLGMGAVSTLLTTASVADRFAGVACAGFDFKGFWKHALATGIAARALARAVRQNGDLAFAAGLLHDIGHLVLAARFPRELGAALQHEQGLDITTLDAERQVMHCDHTDVGNCLALRWRFPSTVVDAIRHHHSPAEVPGRAPSITDLTHVADALVHGLDLLGAPQEVVPAVVSSAWNRVAITDDQFMSVLEQTEEGVAALCQALAL